MFVTEIHLGNFWTYIDHEYRPLRVESDVHVAGLLGVLLPLLEEVDESLLPLHHDLDVPLDIRVVAEAVVVVQDDLKLVNPYFNKFAWGGNIPESKV